MPFGTSCMQGTLLERTKVTRNTEIKTSKRLGPLITPRIVTHFDIKSKGVALKVEVLAHMSNLRDHVY